MEDIVNVFGMMVLFMMFVLLWWAPFLCAQQNKNKNQIFWLTLLLGWIPIVWIVLLLSALLGEKVGVAKRKQ